MKPHDVRDIIECLPKGKTPFHYHKDWYALWLLAQYVGNGKRIQDVKQSRFARLLNKPVMRAALERCGAGAITADDVLYAVEPDQQTFLLSLGQWGSRSSQRDAWFQTSRPGKNLVLQLNFTSLHNRQLAKLEGDNQGLSSFESGLHPIARQKYRTLAWARIDLELEAGEALIEEVQNDWLRFANWKANYLSHLSAAGQARHIQRVFGPKVRREHLDHYFNAVLKPYRAIWDEAILAAALWFLREEVGIARIFYNTWETGCRFKGIEPEYGPPKSLYTDLPRKFCFERTSTPPAFLQAYWSKRLRTHPDRDSFRWFRLDI